MTDIPQEWRAYASKQAQLNRRSSADATAWGLEAGLDGLLDGSTTSATVDRTIGNAARRSRYAQSLLAKYVRLGTSFDGLAYIEARSALTLIADRLSDQQMALLTSSLNEDRMCGTDRTRLSRVRTVIRGIAA